MTKADNTYQNTKVQLPQEADRLSIDSDGLFDFFGSTTTGTQLKESLYVQNQAQIIGQGATSDVFSVVNLPANVRFVMLSMTSTLVAGSFWLTSDPVVGQEVWLVMRGGSVGSGAIVVSASGCSIVGLHGTDISGFTLNNSAASAAKVLLACMNAGEWAVVSTMGNYVE